MTNAEYPPVSGGIPGLPVVLEFIHPDTGEVTEFDLGRSLTSKDYLASRGVTDRYGRDILHEMGLLHTENGRLRLKPEHVTAGLGLRLMKKGSKYPFDALSPTGQAWVEQRWNDAQAAVDARKATVSPLAQEASQALAAYKAWRLGWDNQPMTVQMEVYWLLDHFPSLTAAEMASILSTTTASVKKWSATRSEQRNVRIMLVELHGEGGSPQIWGYLPAQSKPTIRKNTMTTKLSIYADGSSLGNPGPGGWAFIITDDQNGKVIETKIGSVPHTTNNRMELTAAIEALKALSTNPPNVLYDDLMRREAVIYCDSQYVVKGATEWRTNWEAKGFKGTKNKPIANLELWQELYALHDSLQASDQLPNVSFQWVRGHAGNPLNETVDTLARAEAEMVRLSLCTVAG